MSETVLIGIISAGSALLAVLIERLFDMWRRRSEEDRWYADRLLSRKFDAIAELHAQLTDWHYAITLSNVNPPRTLEEYRTNLGAREDSFRRAMSLANVYCDETTEKAIKKAFAAFSQASQAIWFQLPDEEIPNVNKDGYDREVKTIQWKYFSAGHKAANDRLRDLLNPNIIDRLTPSK